MKAEELWKQYTNEKENYEAWAFGGDPDGLADLVLRGIKTATASAYVLYELENEPLPQVGAYSVILNSKDEAVCIIQTTKVDVKAFNQVSEEHAYKEGERDRSLKEWRNIHKEFWRNELQEIGLVFSEEMQVVCEEFIVVYKVND